MPPVNGAIVKERARRLRGVGEASLNKFLQSKLGTNVEVLIEQGRQGHSRHFAPVELTFDAPVGAIVKARVNAIDKEKGRLIAELAA